MLPTHLSKGIIILAIILVWFGIFFNSSIAMISAIALLLVIQWRLFSFHQNTKKVLSSIICHREVPLKFVRVGSLVEVELSLRISVPAGLHVVLQEKISPGVVVQKGNLEYYISGVRNEPVRITYIVTPLVHGSLAFPGLSIRLADQYFSDEISLLNDLFNGPILKVYPFSNYRLNLDSYESGEQEIERIRAISGMELSGFRECAPGDEMKHIDWKMTAKFDKTIVRQYKSLGDSNPLVILDLPEQIEYSMPVHFNTMVQAVSGTLEESWKKYRKTSLVLISGPNIIKMPEIESGIEQSLSILNTYAIPLKRPQNYYRFQTKGTIHSINKEISRIMGLTKEHQDIHNFLKCLYSAISAFQKDPQSVPTFQEEVSQVLRMWPHETVIIFTLFSGDMSHIRYLIEQVHYDHGTVQLHVPEKSGVPGFIKMCMQSGSDSVKVFS